MLRTGPGDHWERDHWECDQSQLGELVLLRSTNTSREYDEVERPVWLSCPTTRGLSRRQSLTYDSRESDIEPLTAEEWLACERRREEHLQASFDGWPKLAVEDNILQMLQTLLPKPDESPSGQQQQPAERNRTTGHKNAVAECSGRGTDRAPTEFISVAPRIHHYAALANRKGSGRGTDLFSKPASPRPQRFTPASLDAP